MILKWLYASWLTYSLNKIRKDENMMAKVYFNRLVLGTVTFDAVPAKYQEQVRAYGKEWVASGKMPIEEYEMLFKEEYSE